MRKKRNTTLWYDDNFVGTELDYDVRYDKIAQACGVNGVQVKTRDELMAALSKAIDDQMNKKETTFIEVLLNQELGEPFPPRCNDYSGFSRGDRSKGYASAMKSNPFVTDKIAVCPPDLLTRAKTLPPTRTAIVCAGFPLPMQSAYQAWNENILEPIFVGHRADIIEQASIINWDNLEFRDC